jgi:hypothetical protein
VDDPVRRRRGIGASLLFLVGAALLSGTALFFWHRYQEKERIIRELALKLERAWKQELVADVRVDAVESGIGGQAPTMRLTFIQYRRDAPDGEAFRVPLVLRGEEFYIDGLSIRFDRDLIEAGDPLRGKSLLLFRRAFGDADRPDHGVPLFDAQGIPAELKVDAEPSEFERRLWLRFWELANDPVAAQRERVAAAQGEAPHMKPVVGQIYMLSLRSSGGIEVRPRLPAAVLKH